MTKVSKDSKVLVVKPAKTAKAKSEPASPDVKQALADQIASNLESQLKMLHHKSGLIRHRQTFIEHRDQLKEFIDSASEENEFEASKKILVFKDKDSYRDEGALSISNAVLVNFFARELLKKIEEKLTQLELEIIS